ncbi:type II toxin-antitoxin system HipA family toxin YjjJ [Methylobacillus caricis]|uniref:type II toxin-antitoxin system HipA family toxin YjjJ n=1 Tax=Methylobacillus caricis TaxID=1971611 RepID=UPI001D00169A|nr:type II toxin-antitoxin system HipA family toxin YjjJ [Methylobacillus caricis]MCB5187934.1 type II toxin-antitoxin system HipA family toxin YjjJ [Methylobacillus caricis]
MRPRNSIARIQVDHRLRYQGFASAADLAAVAGVSVPTVLRIVQAYGDDVVRLGITKGARYAFRRPLRGHSTPIPVYWVNERGQGVSGGALHLLAPEGSFFALGSLGFPVDVEHAEGVWAGLPYVLHDMRPQGYLGRSFARKAAVELEVPSDPDSWSDDQVAYVLSRRGADTSGHLIIGDEAYALWLRSVSVPEPAITAGQLDAEYRRLASESVALIGGGSSAGGEFPKFTAKRELKGSTTPHVIVKFSGEDGSGAVQRWADLLVCEHLALEAIRKHVPLQAACSRVLQVGSRTCLEVERFDRQGEFGRLPLISLSSLDAALLGKGSGRWPDLVAQLAKLGMLPETLEFATQILWWIGQLIGNTDMHLGNLSFQFDPPAGSDTKASALRLSPAYDMLPMMYAPLSGGEVPVRQFIPSLPLPREAEAWKVAYVAAIAFWESAGVDSRISASFRQICLENLAQLQRVRPAVL